MKNENKKPLSNQRNNGYQPKPNGKFGYQPISKSPTPPAPPTSGSNIIIKSKDTAVKKDNE